jgi:hypothetical protein
MKEAIDGKNEKLYVTNSLPIYGSLCICVEERLAEKEG